MKALLFAMACLLCVPPVIAVELTQQERQTRLIELERMLEYIDQQMDHSLYDPVALAERLGPRPDAIAAFLAGSIALRPYWGALKGPDGVLIDRFGNALDRSLLALELLRLNGFTVRLAHTNLPETSVDKLADLADAPIEPPPPSVELTPEMLAVFMAQGRVSADEIRAIHAEITRERDETDGETAAQMPQFLQEVSEVVGDHQFAPPPDDARAQLAEFFWPEYRDETGTWIALDILPLTLDRLVPSGTSYAHYAALSDLPETAFHRFSVTASLLVESADGTEKVVLAETELTSAEAVLEKLELSNGPDLPDGVDFDAIANLPVEEDSVFRFGLERGGALQVVRYTGAGEILSGGPAEATAKGFEGATSRIEDIFAPMQTEPTDRAVGTIAGIVLDYTVTNSKGLSLPPDVRQFSRLVVSEPARPEAGFQAPWRARISLLPFRLGEEYWAYRSLRTSLSSLRLAIRLFRTGAGSPAITLDPRGHHVWPAALIAPIATAADPLGAQTEPGFSDRMTVIVEEGSIGLDADSRTTGKGSIDLVQIADRRSDEQSDVPGIGWSLAESAVLDPETDHRHTGFAQTLLASDAPGEIRQALRLTDAAALGDLALAPDVENQIGSELENGFDVLLLQRGGSVAFMSRDPSSGLWIGRSASGRGQDMTEAAELEVMTIDVLSNGTEAFICMVFSVFSEDPDAALRTCAVGFALNLVSMAPGQSIIAPLLQMGYCLASKAQSPFFCVTSALASGIIGWPSFAKAAGFQKGSSEEAQMLAATAAAALRAASNFLGQIDSALAEE